MLGNAHYEVVHFAFEFYGFDTYNILINPNNPLAQAVLDNMIESGEYFFLAIGPNQSVTAFRSEIGKETLAGITDNLARIKRSIKRRHPNRSAKWLYDKYFRHPFPATWWFHAKSYTADGYSELFKLFKLAHVKIERHVKIRAEATPYDSAYVPYFAKRKKRSSKWMEEWQPI